MDRHAIERFTTGILKSRLAAPDETESKLKFDCHISSIKRHPHPTRDIAPWWTRDSSAGAPPCSARCDGQRFVSARSVLKTGAPETVTVSHLAPRL